MQHIPRILNCAAVKVFAVLDGDIRRSPSILTDFDPSLLDHMTQLAICQVDQKGHYAMYYCNDNWKTLHSQYFNSIAEAMSEAELIYNGITEKWIEPRIAARQLSEAGQPRHCAFCGEDFATTNTLIAGEHAYICFKCVASLYTELRRTNRVTSHAMSPR